MSEARDQEFMRRAIGLARDQMGKTWPNPAVACVVVKDGEMVAEAATAPGGRPHAEEQAVPAAGDRAKGATAYVTMEPCGARSSGRTSCAQYLIEAGVERVVIACLDPSPFAAGRGVERVRAKGLEVETGVLSDEAAILYEGYLHRLESGRPMVRISENGDSFDGQFAASAKADLATELKRLGEAGYTRLWTAPGPLADALREQGLLTE
ncbi:bifunctional diaminohydroxyphosphoribosylaminopyrimidine deaminase/5-amino-6-(5-phosphoribosylamino)uracil reductase RibD [Brevundimonas sp. BAL450]|jgi:diaminohydroxyphosphoribosylaminopyrimidine deaminase / 5-amino-6-(5-phosphoribosylamino)uracil reductase|uniref:Diaminohydroxyphosphoribosylaminopyrimidine deaminase / 5-amino-6-(5-phosphoribosylamino)uracil reductase n=1 Tax=Brevundimonas abyssalis TAR-001 TaxID=1391729 RepID=A0A8E0NCE0_9CAUL|nr:MULTISPECIES: bifunctional diaminohydroxyphosphoribosylaminopyrimidine deaminase/5-amino-6-(5-phosphoribosylamino)uracil reductase RibD [Brevundimonas]MBG7614435.1 bifunctional diaminohydroxyphosphoribosylaminopyrimidine deaminase/5-amino-6-(5-phosphoribosylamino)uracil reductase RibD [Brevundimonas sp. BAL450]GAD59761.1 diaminohydroxyphosphoribosylaminopyrimidine deaminase / 5-amino-6-(5-phosphoribosylamino)uracil reductase [Brevundimonas abyssalis TAR-001]